MSKKSAPRYKTLYINKNSPASSGRGRKMLVVFIILLSFLLSWLKIRNPDTFAISHVKIIDNSNQIEHQSLRDTIFPYLSKGMLWINLLSLQNAIENIPWVQEAIITRHFPHTLVIQIIERYPIAKWNEIQLLDSHGSIFNPPAGYTFHPSGFLPSLFGPDNLQNSVWNDFQESSASLSPLGLSIKTLKLNEDGSCDILLNNDIHLIFNDKSLNVNLSQFVAVYPRICQSHEKDIESIDLRYSNGFAIQWKNNKIHP
jgi:cell division protein FtsQ